jgi:signal transduction histidine kinase/integral membrane sensor domain MASE1
VSKSTTAVAWIRGVDHARLLPAGVVLILLLEIALARYAVRLSPPGSDVAAYWPNSGLSVVALILTVPRWRPATLAGIFVVTVIGNTIGGRDLQVAAGFGVTNVGEAALAAWLLMSRAQSVTVRGDSSAGVPSPPGPVEEPGVFLPDRPRLETVDDFIRLFVACAFASMLGGVLAGATIGLLVGGDPVLTTRTVFASHLAAMLLIVPLAMRLPRDPDLGVGRLEVLAQWATLAVVILAVFFGSRTLPLVFIIYPVLVWGALRFQPRVTALTLLVAGGAVGVLAIAGGGPYVDALTESGQPPELVVPMLQGHLLATVLVTLPLALMKSQRLHVLDDLTRSHEELDAILAATSATAIVGVGRDGRIEYVNVGTERITGYTAPDLIGKANIVLVDENEAPRPGDAIRVAFAFGEAPGEEGPLRDLVDPLLDSAGGTFVHDWDVERADGERLTVSAALSRRYDASGAPAGYLAVAEDVTERRRQERAVQEALASEKLAVDRLAQLDQSKNDFLATVSHELRTPITSILGYSQLLMGQDSDALPAVQRQVVSRIERNGRRLMGLIEDMLAMSQIEVGSFAFSRVPLDVREPLGQAVESTLSLLPARGLTLRQEVPEASVLVAGDADKLERAFANLLSNAVKFSHPGEEISVRVHATDEEAVVSVTDTGVGIDAVDQEQLFERFFRGAVATDQAIQGAGLGLPITAKIVAGHDGHIDIDSTPGVGSTFTIRLPLLVEAP